MNERIFHSIPIFLAFCYNGDRYEGDYKSDKKDGKGMKDPFVHKNSISVIQMFKDKIKKNQRVVMLKRNNKR